MRYLPMQRHFRGPWYVWDLEKKAWHRDGRGALVMSREKGEIQCVCDRLNESQGN